MSFYSLVRVKYANLEANNAHLLLWDPDCKQSYGCNCMYEQLLMQRMELSEAGELLQRALSTCTSIKGVAHIDSQRALHNLLECLDLQEDAVARETVLIDLVHSRCASCSTSLICSSPNQTQGRRATKHITSSAGSDDNGETG